MTIDVVAAGLRRTFELSRLDAKAAEMPGWSSGTRQAGRGWRVTSGGRSQDVSLAAAGGCWSLLVGDIESDGPTKSYEVTFDGRLVHVNGRAISTKVVRQLLVGLGAGHGDAVAVRRRELITTPMPGRVVRVLVARGDTVADRQGLVVVEAMKMENELRAPRAGVVAEVRVVAGTAVEARAVVVVLD